MSLYGSSYSKDTTAFSGGDISASFPKKEEKKVEIPLRQIVLGKEKSFTTN